MSKKAYLGYIVGFSLLVGAVILSVNQPSTKQQKISKDEVLADVTCSIPSGKISALSLDPTRIEIKINTDSLSGVSRVDFVFSEDSSANSGNETVIGKGVRDAGSNTWRMIWDTSFYDQISTAIPGRFRSTIHFTNNSSCQTPYSSVFSIPANSLIAPDIEAFVNPNKWSSLVNTSIGVNADFAGLPPDLHQYVIINWQPTIGYIASPNARNTTYFTGPSAGSGRLRLNAIYSGNYMQKDIDVLVYSSTNTTNSGSNNDDSTSSNSGSGSTSSGSGSGGSTSNSDDDKKDELPEIRDDAKLDDIITILAPTTAEPSQLQAPSRAIALVLQSNDEVKTCIVEKAGDDTVSTILRENRRPRGDEFTKIVKCFETQKNVVPSILAPVAPEEVKTVTESTAVAIRNLANSVKRNAEDDKEKTTLVIEGVAKPETDVLIYVFSEPLVLATTADGDGNWSYTLEDPIEPGDHEVYAMVDRGDGVYERSGVASFFIGTAEASEENPTGLSLELVTEPTITASNRSANLYIAATIGIVTFSAVLIAGYFMMTLKNHRDKGKQQTANEPLSTNEESSTYKSFIDGQ